MNKKKLVIIGGSKFIGKSFVNYFSTRTKYKNFKIILLLRNSLKKKIPNKNIIIIKKDFKKIKEIPECDFILYCLRANSIKEDSELFENFKKKIFKLKKKPKIIFTSSGVLYGLNKKKIKINERFKVTKKFKNSENYKYQWFSQKLSLEKNFFDLAKYNYKIVILRMFSFIGPNILDQNYSVSKFYKNIKYNQKITINGPINTFRSYLDEVDTVEWLIRIFLNFKYNFKIYNFGCDKPIKIYDLLKKMVGKKYSNKIKLTNKSNQLDYYVPSIKKLKSDFNLKKKISLDNSIKKLYSK